MRRSVTNVMWTQSTAGGDTGRGVDKAESAVGEGVSGGGGEIGVAKHAPRFRFAEVVGCCRQARSAQAGRLTAGSESHGSGPPGRDETVQGPETQDTPLW